MNVTNVASPWNRDENAARNILDRALSEVGLIFPARGGLVDDSLGSAKLQIESGVQLSLF